MVNTAITYTRRYFFYGHNIDTTVTKDPYAVNAWITETESIYRNHRGIIGLDTEWRPSFQPGVQDPIAILQLCVDNRCLVFQIIHSGQFLPLSLINFLNNPNYTFTGVGINTDIQKLLRCGLGRGPNCFLSDMVNIQQLAAWKFGLQSMDRLNMNVLARDVLGIDLAEPGNVRISAWDNRFLTDEQVRYASLDAFLSSEMGKALLTD
ncbi:3'-5' exonuclease domain-containing protein [Artemisia annua]|uniref:3'-5' exonuclease domain-containing protein n=1 Tax=Artemisia annua TaxID=35608 RepID=A0A2U1NXU6_ARTAN|nr:3'-5' exonuclease domain-containing protein [Artemisia annua]